MKLGVTLDILNQKGTPAFNADTLANRPAPGYVGRVFISTDTYDLYRDTGTTWVLLSPSSTGTITGSGTTNTLPLWTSASAIGNSALTQNTGVSISIGSVGTPYDFIGYGNNYAAKFIKNGASATDILAGDGSSITAGTGITISGGQISASGGGGGVTGTGSVGQVSYWSGASSITGTNNLFWDSANNRLGVNTNTPTSSFDVHSAAFTNVISQLNQLSTGYDSLLAFQDNSIGKWRIGSYYNSGNFSFGIYDVLYSTERFSIQNGGTTFVGPQTSTSGLFNINSANGDNHLVVIGASAPSMRVRNAGSAATYQFGLGLATTTNNFIQGTTGGEFCIFNDSSTSQPILFGIKSPFSGLTEEAMRITSTLNIAIGTTAPGYTATNRKVLAINGGSFAGEGAIMAFMLGGTNKGYVFSIQNDMEFWCESGAMRIGNAQSFDISLKTNNIDRFIVKGSGVVNIQNIPTSSAGLVTGDIYSSAGVLMIV
jgi:hypothetical protein